MKNITIPKSSEVATRTIAGVTFTTAEIAEITSDLAQYEDEEAREQAELEWFQLMDEIN